MNINFLKNPYIGLRPFDLEDNLIFFGRQEETQNLLEKLHQHRFVAVIGSSGSGKSSLIRAGLIPKLLAGFLVRDRDHWQTATFRPGSRPLENLGLGLGQLRPDKALEIKETLVHEIRGSGPDTVIPLVRSCLQDAETNLLILVDQFEELFRYQIDADKSGEEADLFVASILSLAKQQSVPAYVVITMRSDFLGDCAAFPDLSEAINRSVFLVPRMRPLQIREAIEAPLRLFGGSISLRLHERIAEDLRAYPFDQLPLLQHALMRAYEFWSSRNMSKPIDLEEYESIGGLSQSINQHAEWILAQFTEPTDMHGAERMFRCLTAREHGRSFRRPSSIRELCAVTEAPVSMVVRVIEPFRQAFMLVPPPGVPLADNTIIDITHESLMRQWFRLVEWIQRESESAATYRKLCYEASWWAKDQDAPLRGAALAVARDWQLAEQPNSAWAQRYETNNSFETVMRFLEDSFLADRRRSLFDTRRTVWIFRVGLFVVGGLLGVLLMLLFR
jgi:hypothetical protein